MKRQPLQYRTKHRNYKPPDFEDIIYLVLVIAVVAYITFLYIKASGEQWQHMTNH
jgi:hypothetical protein